MKKAPGGGLGGNTFRVCFKLGVERSGTETRRAKRKCFSFGCAEHSKEEVEGDSLTLQSMKSHIEEEREKTTSRRFAGSMGFLAR